MQSQVRPNTSSSRPSASTASIRTVRPLVPFFIPGADIVNETLAPYHTPSPSNLKSKTKSNKSNPVTLSVRQWDHTEGFFKDAVQVVEDVNPNHHQQQQQQQQTQNIKPRLLTPANIRAAKELARRRAEESNSNTYPSMPIDTKVTSDIPQQANFITPSTSSPNIVTPKKGRGKQYNNRDRNRERRSSDDNNNYKKNYYQNQSSQQTSHPQSSPGNTYRQKSLRPRVNQRNDYTQQNTPEGKPRPFAGSTFETASPPPSGLPIPGFIAKLAAASPPSPSITVSSNTTEYSAQEQAAVELRKMLRI